jgi:hypothetical protein
MPYWQLWYPILFYVYYTVFVKVILQAITQFFGLKEYAGCSVYNICFFGVKYTWDYPFSFSCPPGWRFESDYSKSSILVKCLPFNLFQRIDPWPICNNRKYTNLNVIYVFWKCAGIFCFVFNWSIWQQYFLKNFKAMLPKYKTYSPRMLVKRTSLKNKNYVIQAILS